ETDPSTRTDALGIGSWLVPLGIPQGYRSGGRKQDRTLPYENGAASRRSFAEMRMCGSVQLCNGPGLKISRFQLDVAIALPFADARAEGEAAMAAAAHKLFEAV